MAVRAKAGRARNIFQKRACAGAGAHDRGNTQAPPGTLDLTSGPSQAPQGNPRGNRASCAAGGVASSDGARVVVRDAWFTPHFDYKTGRAAADNSRGWGACPSLRLSVCLSVVRLFCLQTLSAPVGAGGCCGNPSAGSGHLLRSLLFAPLRLFLLGGTAFHPPTTFRATCRAQRLLEPFLLLAAAREWIQWKLVAAPLDLFPDPPTQRSPSPPVD